MTESQSDQIETARAAPATESVEVTARRAPRPLLTGADIYVVLILGILLAALLSGNLQKFLGFLYNPIVFLLVVTVCVTYLFFKSSDRSRAYKDELELMRGLRRRDATQRRELERRMKDLAAQCRAGDEALSPEDRQRLANEIDQLIAELRKN